MWCYKGLFLLIVVYRVLGKDSEANTAESGDEDSGERIGVVVTQVTRHPYVATLLKNSTYVCSAVVLNTYWLLTLSKCFDSDVISSYVTQKNLGNYTIRTGSSYNNKSGSINQIKMLINNFDLKVSAVKLLTPLEFGPNVRSVQLPNPDDEVSLGYLASLMAWTPTGHLRVVNVPVIDVSICDSDNKLQPGHYICVGGVQDPNRHFCRQDNGGAVIQNNTLIAISSFLHTCAVYTKTHAFPKVSSFSRWLDTVIWDENNRPTFAPPTVFYTTKTPHTVETTSENRNTYFGDPMKFMLTLPFDPVNLPLEPSEDNSVLPRLSLYESYLQNLSKSKSTTTPEPAISKQKMAWLRRYGKMMIPMMPYPKKYDQYDYN